MKITIFGSCVTRDLFEDPALRPWLAHYPSRSSVISAVAQKVPLAEEEVTLDSAYQRRAVLADFNKTFCVDERFSVLRTDESFVTESSAFSSAGSGTPSASASRPCAGSPARPRSSSRSRQARSCTGSRRSSLPSA